MIENNAPIRKDTKVGFGVPGPDRVAAISLTGGGRFSATCAARRRRVPMLTADPNSLQDVTEAIRGTLQNINRVVADNQEVGEELAA